MKIVLKLSVIYKIQYIDFLIRQVSKEAAKEAATQDEKKLLQLTLQNIALHIEKQDAQIRHLSRTVADLESRKWLPKLKILSSDSKDDDTGKDGGDGKSKLKIILTPGDIVEEKNLDENSSQNGNFNPNDGILMKSLNLIENEIFYSSQHATRESNIIRDALVFLKYDLYK